MNLALEVFLRILALAYLGAAVWFTILILRKAGHAWWWSLVAWGFGIFLLIPNLEFVALFGLLVPLLLLWLFAFFEWPALIDTSAVGHRSRGLTDIEAESLATGGHGRQTELLGAGEATPRAGRRSPSGSTTWLLSGFDDAGHTVRLEVTDRQLDSADKGVLVGRNPQLVDLVISDDSVSRRHALLRRKGKLLVIEDLESANGTIVNGERLQPRRGFACDRGAVVEFGGVKLTVSRG